MLQDGEIGHRQHKRIHSDSLHMNVKKDSTVGEKTNIDTFVITEGNVAQTAVWTAYSYDIIQFECLLPAVSLPPTSTVRNFRFFP